MDSLCLYAESDEEEGEVEDDSHVRDLADNKMTLGAENDKPKHDSSITLCELCNSKARIYKCPRCGVGTCSLACCRRHKVASACSGVRDRSSYVGIKDFQEKNLRSDFHFLEDVLQSKNSAKRNVVSNFGGQASLSSKRFMIAKNNNESSYDSNSGGDMPVSSLELHSKQIKKLVNAARARQTRLLIMPAGMQKRAKNTTYFNNSKRSIHWRIHAVFILGNDYNSKDLLHIGLDGSSDINYLSGNSCLVGASFASVSETVTLQSLIDLIFGSFSASEVPEDSKQVDLTTTQDENSASESINSNSNSNSNRSTLVIPEFDSTKIANLRYTLRYLRKSYKDIQCFIQKLPSPSSTPLFHEVPLGFSIKDALQGKTVIEYPLFIFGLQCDTVQKLEISHLLLSFQPAVQNEATSNVQKKSTYGKNNNRKRTEDGSSKPVHSVTGSENNASDLSKIGLKEVVTRKINASIASSESSSSLQLGSSTPQVKKAKVMHSEAAEMASSDDEEGDEVVASGAIYGDPDCDVEEVEGYDKDDDNDDNCSIDDFGGSGHLSLLGSNKGGVPPDDAMDASDAIEEKEFMLALEEFAHKDINSIKAFIAKYESNDE